MKDRLHYLDGLRGVAVLAVIAAHLRHVGQLVPVPDVLLPLANGDFGVNIFFVLSGYLITHVLRKEGESACHTNLWRFYARRSFRLWPALLLFVAVVGALDFFTGPACQLPELFYAATFSSDLFLNGLPVNNCLVVGHTWSLTVEEVFYLLWAPAILFLSRRFKTTPILLLVMLLSILATVGNFASLNERYSAHPITYFNVNVLARMGAVAVGALLSEWLSSARLVQWKPRRLPMLLGLAFLWFVVVAVRKAQMQNELAYVVVPFRHLLQALFAAAVILVCTKDSEGPVARFLSFRPLAWCGVVSYSLYLWQQLFTQKIGLAASLYWWQQAPYSVVFIFFTAAISFYLLELPLTHFARRRWHRPANQPQNLDHASIGANNLSGDPTRIVAH